MNENTRHRKTQVMSAKNEMKCKKNQLLRKINQSAKQLQKNISTIIHYPYPLHKTKAYSSYKYRKGEFSNGEFLSDKILSLPNYPGMTNDKISYVCSEINKFYKK